MTLNKDYNMSIRILIYSWLPIKRKIYTYMNWS